MKRSSLVQVSAVITLVVGGATYYKKKIQPNRPKPKKWMEEHPEAKVDPFELWQKEVDFLSSVPDEL